MSQSAREAIERQGGTVEAVYYHPLALRRGLRPSEELPPPQQYRQ